MDMLAPTVIILKCGIKMGFILVTDFGMSVNFMPEPRHLLYLTLILAWAEGDRESYYRCK